MSNPFDLAGEMPADTNPFEGADAIRHAVQTTKHTWTEAETCEAWGGCEQHPVPPVVAATDEAIAAGASAPWGPGEREAMIAATAEPGPAQVIEPKRATIAPATNRADAIRVIAACEAVAKALREGLTGEARSEYDDNGTRAVYDVTGIGKVVASISQPGIEIEDRDAWMAYAATKWAEEIKMIPTWINPAVEKEILAALVKLPEIVTDKEIAPIMDARDKGEVIGADGAIIPGLAWRTGGTFKAASLTVDPKLKRHMSEVARNYVAGASPLQIEGGA